MSRQKNKKQLLRFKASSEEHSHAKGSKSYAETYSRGKWLSRNCFKLNKTTSVISVSSSQISEPLWLTNKSSLLSKLKLSFLILIRFDIWISFSLHLFLRLQWTMGITRLFLSTLRKKYISSKYISNTSTVILQATMLLST